MRELRFLEPSGVRLTSIVEGPWRAAEALDSVCLPGEVLLFGTGLILSLPAGAALFV